MDTQWHAGPDLLRQYAAGRLDPVAQAAVETHVERCAGCRQDAIALVAPPELDLVWDRVIVEVRSPEPDRLTRLLRRLHVPDVDTVVLRTSTNLLLAMSIATIGAFGFAIAAAQLPSSRQQVAWLAIAPLLPALLVAGAYDSTDPMRALTDATPYSKLRVALLRTLVAVLAALPPVLLMGLVPHVGATVVTWLLPALAISLVLLVLLSRVRAGPAVTVVVAAWLLLVTVLRAGERVDVVAAPLGQLVALAVVLLATAYLVRELGPRPARSNP